MLKDKALENLAAGELLLGRGFPNAAARRLYYSMYQAAVHRFAVLRLEPTKLRSGAVDWDHSMVENNTKKLGGDWRDKALYAQMRRLRSQADYGDERVGPEKLSGRLEAVADFVRRVTG